MLPTLVRGAKAHYTKAPSHRGVFKRAQQGLFGGKSKLFGNNVPESHQKTRRDWLPNVQRASLYSAALDQKVDIKVTTAVLRDIDKVGGLDEYLLKPGFRDVLGKRGEELREQVLLARQTMRMEDRARVAQNSSLKKAMEDAFTTSTEGRQQ